MRHCIANYEVSFEPNPLRLHTRGRRGRVTEGFTAEQIDFEESRREEDRSTRREAGVDRERVRLERAQAKHFALRGFKGKGFAHLRGEERMDSMKAAARRARVSSGTEGMSKAKRRFLKEEGVGWVSTRSSLPWNSRTGRHHAKVVAPQKVPFDLKSAVARFKRTGDLPDVTVEEVRGGVADGIDGRALKRMISAMLLKAGIETNPGPAVVDVAGEPACLYAGQRVQGERVRVHGQMILVCPHCPTRLTEVRGPTGLHPGEKVDSPVAVVVQPALARIPTPVPSPVVTTQMTPTEVVIDIDTPETKPVKAIVSRPAVAVRVATTESVLCGHAISDADCEAVMSRLVGHDVDIDHIQFENVVVPYKGERRLATSRNIQEIKQAFHACQLSVHEKPSTWLPVAYYAACVVASVAELVAIVRYRQPYPAVVSAALLAVATIGFFLLPSRRSRLYSVAFVPHLVSAVMAEYDRGTNVTAARTTLRQKIRRLACLPIPDEDALKFITGSELICEQLLSHEDFFWEGAACFRQPV